MGKRHAIDSPRIPGQLALDTVTGDGIHRRFGITGDERGPVKIVRIHDPKSDRTWGYVAVDNLARGPSLGGIRMAPDITAGEVYHLAAAMTLKSAAAMLPLGGGKAGIVGSPAYYAGHPSEKRALMTAYGKALFHLPEYVPGPDMGTCEDDMQLLYEVFTELTGRAGHGRGGVGRPPEKGGLPLDAWGITAHGLFAAAEVAQEHVKNFRIAGARVVVQGYGNVGCHIARKLYDAGAVIVGASDINRALYHRRGLDVAALESVRSQPQGLKLYRGPVEQEFEVDELERLLAVPCDVLVPAARPDAITCENADHVDTRIILQGANNPVHGVIEHYLGARRGVISLTDWIVNAGGVIACAVELRMDADRSYRERVLKRGKNGRKYLEELVYRTISRNVGEIFERVAADKGKRRKTFREHALDMAVSRLSDPALLRKVWL